MTTLRCAAGHCKGYGQLCGKVHMYLCPTHHDAQHWHGESSPGADDWGVSETEVMACRAGMTVDAYLAREAADELERQRERALLAQS